MVFRNVYLLLLLYMFHQFRRKCHIGLPYCWNQQSNHILLSRNVTKKISLNQKENYLRSNQIFTRHIPAIHMSLVPILHGVPSAAESPHGTMTVSSESVQYNLQVSSENLKVNFFITHTTYKMIHKLLLLFYLRLSKYGSHL